MASQAGKAERKRLKDEYLRAQQAASAARMTLDRPQLEALLDHVQAAVAADGCDHTRTATDDWAVREGIDLDRLHEGLEEYGGFCDCEVVLDVDADEVFTPVRTPRGRPMGRGLSEPRPAGADLAHTVSPAPPPAGGTDTGSPRNSGVADQGRSDAGRCDDAAVEPAVVERTENTIVVTSVIPAPPSALFAVLADPAEHARIDGSGTVTATADGGGPAPLTAVGQVFTMAMHQDRPGPEDYRTDNHVVELVPERLITWTTARAGQPPPGVRWSWQLEPVEGGTRVRHVYDWSQVHDPAVLARVSFPRVAPEQLVGTMQRLAALVTDRTTG